MAKRRKKKKSRKLPGPRISKGEKARRRRETREFIISYLKSHPCVDCGEKDIVVLQFDHIRGEKKGNVTSLSYKGYSLRTVKAEIKKTVVRCASCHVRKTAKERNWYRCTI